MDKLLDVSAWREVFVHAFVELGKTVAGLLPSLVAAILILLIGWAISRSVEIVACKSLRTLGLDRAATRLRLTDVLERAGIGLGASEIVARLLFWLLILTFLVSSAETLGLMAVTSTIEGLIAYIPNLIGAGLLTLVGLLLARFVGSVVGSAAAAADFPSAARLGFLARSVVAGLVIVAAIEQVGIATGVLVGPLTALLGAAALTAGLTFALGARPIVTHILAGHFLKQSLPRDAFVEIGGQRGVVERIGPTDTLLRNDERSWSVPNGRLLEDVVVR